MAADLFRAGLAALGMVWLVAAAPPPAAPASPPAPASAGTTEELEKAQALVKQLGQSAQRAEEGARRSAAEAERARKQAQALVDASESQRKEALARAEAAQQAADAKKAEAEEARRKAAQAGAALARQRDERDKADERLRWVLIAGSAVILAAAVAALLLWRRARSRRIEPSRNCVLTSPRVNLPLSGKSLPLAAGGVILGRNPREAQAVINDNDVSRRHAKVFWDEGAFWIEDLESLNGTRVNGEPLEAGVRRQLRSGDVVDVADVVEFRFDVLG